jgi:hypothetical protein
MGDVGARCYNRANQTNLFRHAAAMRLYPNYAHVWREPKSYVAESGGLESREGRVPAASLGS